MSISILDDLGITRDELIDRVVERVASDVIEDDGYPNIIEARVNKMVEEKIAQAVTDLGDRVIGPRASEMIESIVMQRTNTWGEKVGEPVTFIEYLVSCAEKYMTETVNYEGKAKGQAGYGSWSGTQTRVAHMIDKHLHYSIARAMESALQTANSRIAEGLAETVKMKLAEVSDSLKVNVGTGR